MKMYVFIVMLFLLTGSAIYSQDDSVNVTWKRGGENVEEEVHLFRSPHAINLPTTECMEAGNFEFEISHRFLPTIRSGSKDFWGFDGPVNMRIALGYAITNNSIVTLGRSNLSDNVDLQLKYTPLQIANENLPMAAGVRLGAAWNTDNSVVGPNAKAFQWYAQLILNTVYKNKLGIGLVPSYLHNSYILTDDTQYSFTMGTYVQYYFSSLLGVLAEWNPLITGFRLKNNPVAFGIELNTGGHFFKVILTNSSELNPSQFLAGTRSSFNNGEWHIGFNITRLLAF